MDAEAAAALEYLAKTDEERATEAKAEAYLRIAEERAQTWIDVMSHIRKSAHNFLARSNFVKFRRTALLLGISARISAPKHTSFRRLNAFRANNLPKWPDFDAFLP